MLYNYSLLLGKLQFSKMVVALGVPKSSHGFILFGKPHNYRYNMGYCTNGHTKWIKMASSQCLTSHFLRVNNFEPLA